MISILVVGPASVDAADVEVLTARDADEAVEKLARNRRVDAVLIADPANAAEVAAAIQEDVLSPPPIFSVSSAPQIAGVRRLPGPGSGETLRRVIEALETPPPARF